MSAPMTPPMSDTITGAPSLESLSEAAAKGRLEIGAFDVDGFGVPLTAVHDEASVGGILPEGLVAVATLLYTEYPIDHHDARPERAEANAAYLGGLWNEHRAGRLHTSEALAQAVAAAREEGRVVGLGEAADWLAPSRARPCDCERCDCGNVGDLAEVAAWDAENDLSRAIRALIAPPTPAQIDTAPGGRADG